MQATRTRIGKSAASRADGLQRLLRPAVQSTLDINEAGFVKDATSTALDEKRCVATNPSQRATGSADHSR